MSNHTIAIVTGANKGIGLAIVRNLALQYPKSTFNKGPFLVYLTARSQQRGEDALAELHKDPQLAKAKALSKDGGLTDIKYQALDITQTKSIQNFRDFLKREHPDGVDIVVNNAGIALDGFDAAIVKKTLECNYYGTLEASQDLLPLVKPSGRLINVASVAGSLSKYSPELKEAFTNPKNTIADYTKLMQDFQQAVADGTYKEKGWPSSAYMVSKAGVIGLTKALAREEEAGNSDKSDGSGNKRRLINAVCPGYVDTDMSKHRGHKSVDDGAATPVLLALGDIGGVSGEFWSEGEVVSWDQSLVRTMFAAARRKGKKTG